MWILAQIYVSVCGSVLVGIAISALLGTSLVQSWFPRSLQQQLPTYLGRFLFWAGIPGSLIHFLRQADLSGRVFIAALMAWIAFAISSFLAWCWLQIPSRKWSMPTKGTFLIASMVGNTGFLGFPIVLLLPQLGPAYFGWALFYDLLGTLFTAYGMGVMVAAYYGRRDAAQGINPIQQSLNAFLRAPTLPAFLIGLGLRPVPFPVWLSLALQGFAWSIVTLSLILMGMRLQQLRSLRRVPAAMGSAIVRMAIAPLSIGLLLTAIGITGPPRLAIVLQAGMPSALATLVLTETFNLDRELAVTCLGVSSATLLLTLPIWLWCFPA